MKKDNALQRIESHEKLCRIMQKQTYDKMNKLEKALEDIEKLKDKARDQHYKNGNGG